MAHRKEGAEMTTPFDTEPLHEKEARERILEKLGRSGDGPWAVVGVVVVVVVAVAVLIVLVLIL